MIDIEIETKLNSLTIRMPRQVPWYCAPGAPQDTTKRGRNPTHPLGDRLIDSKLGVFMTQHYFEETEGDEAALMEGDRLC